MRYSSDFRKCVLDFIKNGGSKAEASRTFGVSRPCIYNWLAAEDPLTWKKPGPQGPRCLDYDALAKHVADFPDSTLLERAAHFEVSRHGIWYALSKLNITRKKKASGIRSNAP
jgi:transposase